MRTNFEKFTSKKQTRQEASNESYKQVYAKKLHKTKRGTSQKREWNQSCSI